MSYFFDYNHDLLHYYSLYFHHYCIYCLYHHFHHQLIIMDIITSYDLISCNGNILLVAILHPCHWMIVSYLLIGPRISLSHSCQIPSCWTSRQPSQLLTIIGNSNINLSLTMNAKFLTILTEEIRPAEAKNFYSSYYVVSYGKPRTNIVGSIVWMNWKILNNDY